MEQTNPSVSIDWKQQLEASEQQVTALREDLLKFGKHKEGCGIGTLCDCGWTVLTLSILKAQKDALASTPVPAPETGDDAWVEEKACLNCGNPESHHVRGICSAPTNEPPETGHDSQCERVPQPEDNFERLAICQCEERAGETGTVCPCTGMYSTGNCGACYDIRPAHSRKCLVESCVDGRIQQKEE